MMHGWGRLRVSMSPALARLWRSLRTLRMQADLTNRLAEAASYGYSLTGPGQATCAQPRRLLDTMRLAKIRLAAVTVFLVSAGAVCAAAVFWIGTSGAAAVLSAACFSATLVSFVSASLLAGRASSGHISYGMFDGAVVVLVSYLLTSVIVALWRVAFNHNVGLADFPWVLFVYLAGLAFVGLPLIVVGAVAGVLFRLVISRLAA